MDFTSHDIAVIEQALQLAINAESKDSKVNHFREVLTKLQKKCGSGYARNVPSNGFARRSSI